MVWHQLQHTFPPCAHPGELVAFFYYLNPLRLIARYAILLKIFIFSVCICKCRQAHAVVPTWWPEGTFGNKFCPSTQPRLSASIGKGFYLLMHLADVSLCLSLERSELPVIVTPLHSLVPLLLSGLLLYFLIFLVLGIDWGLTFCRHFTAPPPPNTLCLKASW